MGLHLSLRAHGRFILPAVFFIAQLQHPPSYIVAAEKKAHTIIAASPRGWHTMGDLQHLHNLGPKVDARSLQLNANAARLRTALWDNSTQGGIP